MRDGTKVVFPGRGELVVPPFNLRTVKKIVPVLHLVQQEIEDLKPEHIDAMATVIAAAFGANTPEITEDVVLDEVPFGELKPLLDKVLTASGMEKRKEGEPAGEATGVASTGTSSTST